MSKEKLIVSACDFINPNAYSAQKLTGVAKRRLVNVVPQQLQYNASKNRYFQPAKNYHDIFQYSENVAKDFWKTRNVEFNRLDVDEYADDFLYKVERIPTTEFKILRGKEDKVYGGFSTHINGDELHVSSFYLDDAHKKRGIIQEMFEAIKHRAEEHNCKSITADIVGDAELKRSERMGFSEKKKSFWQHLLDWDVLDRYVMKNREVTCPVERFGKGVID